MLRCHRERRLHLRRLPHLDPVDAHAHDAWLAQVPRLHGRRQRAHHADPGSDHVVRDLEDALRARCLLGRPASLIAELAATGGAPRGSRPLERTLANTHGAQLTCCGYANSTSPLFVTDSVCTDALVAAEHVGCIGPFSVYGNNFLDLIFTAFFGAVGESGRIHTFRYASADPTTGIDVALILAIAMVLKERKEQARYRFIDEKSGAGGF